MAEQYLEFGRDARKAAATRNWLVQALVGAARKRQDFATARLLAIRPAALATIDTATAPAPSLDDFAAQHDPDASIPKRNCLQATTSSRLEKGVCSEQPLISLRIAMWRHLRRLL